jgi:hypothetical protein
MRIFIAIFVILHGLVHLLYLGQSWRLFELQPKMVWPDGSWSFSRLLGNEATRLLACAACGLAAAGFVGGGIGIVLEQNWWRPLILGAAAVSAAAYILFWNGKFQGLDNQGVIGLLIDIALLVVVLGTNFE